jgi:hypothetical protein
MRKAFPQKMLAELGLDASAPSSSTTRGRRRRTTVVTTPVRTSAARALDHLARTLQPEPNELDLGWNDEDSF